MNVIQSYLTTIMHGDFSLYEIRIFIKIVERAYQKIRGQRMSRLIGTAVSADGINCNISIPMKEILSENSKATDRVIAAAKNLMNKKIEVWDTDSEKWVTNEPAPGRKKRYRYSSIINNISYGYGDGMLSFSVPIWVMEYILNFINNNYSRYDLTAALSLPSAYAVRMYWLTCSMKDPVKYPLSMLRAMLQVGNKYPQPKDFIRRCIDPPRRILADRNLNGFNYTIVHKNPKSKTSPITHIWFMPVKRQTETKKAITAMAGTSTWVNPSLRQYLANKMEFKDSDFAALKSEMFEFSKIGDWPDIIVRIIEHAKKKNAGKGYVIQAIRSEIASHRKA